MKMNILRNMDERKAGEAAASANSHFQQLTGALKSPFFFMAT